MNIILLDIGNTNIKIAMKENDESYAFIKSYKRIDLFYKFFSNIIKKYNIDRVFYASVKGDETKKIIERLTKIAKPKLNDFFVRISYLKEAGFKFNYNPIKSYGDDRLALLYYISFKYPERTVLAIDSGTAITIDTMYNLNYEGGCIFCGINLCFKSLFKRTKQLPLLSIEDLKNIENISFGFSTKESILSGFCYNYSGFILKSIQTFKNKIYEKYNIKNPELTIIITGGDADIIYNLVKDKIEDNTILLDKNAVISGIDIYGKIYLRNL